MRVQQEAGPKPGTRVCPDCDGEGGFWVRFRWFVCERCLGRGWV
jgi:hypothetical protein